LATLTYLLSIHYGWLLLAMRYYVSAAAAGDNRRHGKQTAMHG
jgi:hypothetical protein